MDNPLLFAGLAAVSVLFMALAAFGGIILLKLLLDYKKLKALSAEEGAIPIEEHRLCKSPHEWETIDYVDSSDVEDVTSEESIKKAIKPALACLKCGLISGKDRMLGAGAVGKMKYASERNKLENKMRESLEQKITKVISEFTEEFPVVSEGRMRVFVDQLSSLPQEVQREVQEARFQKILGDLK